MRATLKRESGEETEHLRHESFAVDGDDGQYVDGEGRWIDQHKRKIRGRIRGGNTCEQISCHTAHIQEFSHSLNIISIYSFAAWRLTVELVTRKMLGPIPMLSIAFEPPNFGRVPQEGFITA